MGKRNYKTTDFEDLLGIAFAPKPKPRRKLARNDNGRTPYSGMSFTAAKALQKREADLEWQINFASMKLKRWMNPDMDHWGSLDRMLKIAKAERAAL